MKKALTGLTPVVTDQRDAFDVLEGLPMKADHIPPALAPYVPAVYYEGAIGWTGHAFALTELEDAETGELTGEAVIFVPDELHAEHPDGTVVELPDGRFVTIDLSAAIDVLTEGGGAPMIQLTGLSGSVWIRAVRVALVQEHLTGGAHIYFLIGEDPVHVTEAFPDVIAALQPEMLIGMLMLTAEEGAIAVNPRYVLSVAESPDLSGTRITMSGSRTFDVEQDLPDVVSALNLV